METVYDIIKAIGLEKTFDGKVKALQGCDLTVKKGEVVAIIGPSGSGKSTMLRCLNLLEVPTAGKVIFDGTDLTQKGVKIDAYRERMGMVFQHFNLFPHKTVLENIMLAPVQLKKKTKAEAKKTALDLLERIGLADKADTYPQMLSGGQKQRIAIAGVVAMHPDIIVFDESTSMLDPSGREDIFDLALGLNRQGVTIIWITHFMEEAARCQRLVIIDDGKIALEGTPREVFSDVKRVKELGLEVPDMTYLAWELKKSGADISTDILTMDEMEAKLWGLMSKT